MNQDISIRPYHPDDEDFVYSTWLESFRANSYTTRRLRKVDYLDFHRGIIKKILDRNPNIKIACLKEDPSVIIGYLVMELGNIRTRLHFIYVKTAFQGLGIGKLLTKDIDFNKAVITHWSNKIHWLYEKFEELVYYPYIV